MRQNSRGVTLITLVVTIIIIIILAGVSINLLFGNDGIITKAKDARDMYSNAAVTESEQLAGVDQFLGKSNTIKKIKFKDGTESVIEGEESLAEDYTKVVDKTFFSSNEGTDWEWQLFYDDKDYIFLIASDYVPINTLPMNGNLGFDSLDLAPTGGRNSDYNAAFTTNFSDYVLSSVNDYANGTSASSITNNVLTSYYLKWAGLNPDNKNPGAKATAFMMDTEKWKQYAKNNNGYNNAFAIGGPTIELFTKSWNAYEENYTSRLGTYILTSESQNTDWTNVGYKIWDTQQNSWASYGNTKQLGEETSMWLIANNYKADAYWVSSPAASSEYTIIQVHNNGTIALNGLNATSLGFRPVVVIPKNSESLNQEVIPETTYKIKFKDGTGTDDINGKEKLANYYTKPVHKTFFSSNEEKKWEWQLFYDDDTYVFLIASDYIPNSKLPLYGNTGYMNSTQGCLIQSSSTTNLYNLYCARFCTTTSYNDYVYSDSKYTAGISSTAFSNNILTNQYLKWINLNPSSSSSSIPAVAFMMDTEKWNQFAQNKYANSFAIGGPTIELFTKSWNAYPSHNYSKIQDYEMNSNAAYTTNEYGYKAWCVQNSRWEDYGVDYDLGTQTDMWSIHETNKSLGYYIASPSSLSSGWALRCITSEGVIHNAGADNNGIGFRPIVVIPKASL